MKLFSFEGRIRRRDYWLYNLGLGIVGAVTNLFTFESTFEIVLCLLILIPYFWAYYAIGAQRCHDCGYNGWWQMVPFFVFVLAFKPGMSGENEYGPDPKEAEIGAYKDNE
ncbi:MAG: DUF805 domain-containing protein [Bacteroidales bacterium]|nr:DUF805 domain-containing protein [Bacteroidales bacterium]MBQ8811991.1 DUF805 domain-containing protein [Bacteroidales bacterium]